MALEAVISPVLIDGVSIPPENMRLEPTGVIFILPVVI
jgi:hypothetical protein